MTAMVEFQLDGHTVSAPEGELLVHAAARQGTFIPTLCHDDQLEPYGGCRMCVVDVEGAPRPLPAPSSPRYSLPVWPTSYRHARPPWPRLICLAPCCHPAPSWLVWTRPM